MADLKEIPVDFNIQEGWVYVNMTSGVLSATFCLYHIIKISKMEQITTLIRIIRQIHLTCLIQSICFVLDYYFFLFHKIPQFAFAPLGIYVFSFLSLGWTIILSLYSYKAITSHKKFNKRQFFKTSVLISYTFLFALLVGTYAIIFFVFGDTILYRLVSSLVSTMYVVVSILVSFGLYRGQLNFIKKSFDKDLLNECNIDLGRLTLFPMMQGLIYSPVIIASFQSVIVKQYQGLPSYQAVCAFFGLAGVFNTLLYQKLKTLDMGADTPSNTQKRTTISLQDSSMDQHDDRMLQQALDD